MDHWEMPSTADWISNFDFLSLDNYPTWKKFMKQLIYFQGGWEIVSGKYTRSASQDQQQFDLIDGNTLAVIRSAIDKEVHPWILGDFPSSKALWDCLQSHKNLEGNVLSQVNCGLLADIITLPVPMIHDDQCITSSLANETVQECLSLSIEQSDIFFLVNDNMNLLKGYDVSHLAQDFQLYEGEYDRQYQIFGLDELDSCHVVENASQDIIQQLQVPFIDDYLEIDGLSSLAQSFMCKASEYVVPELIFECTCTSSKGSYESVYQKSDWSPLGNDPLLYASFVIWDEVFEHQVYTADYKDEFILELPRMDTHEQTAGFTSIITKVSQYALDLPLYMNINIPFACTHDGIIKDHASLAECLGYAACPAIQGISQALKVSFECLHLRNQVLLIVDVAEEHDLVDSDVKSGTWSQVLAGQCEFQCDQQ